MICEVAVDALAGVSAASAAASASSPASPALGLTPGLEAQLASIMPCLHPLVAVPLDYRVPATVRNHSELLRCFEVLGANAIFGALSSLFQCDIFKQRGLFWMPFLPFFFNGFKPKNPRFDLHLSS